ERIGDQARMLAASAAETIERIAGDVVAALYGNLLDGVRHVLDRDRDEAVGNLLRAPPTADLARQACEGRLNCFGIERLVLWGPEHAREETRHQLAEHHISVSDRKRAAAAIALRPRIGAGRVRPDAKARAVEMQNRAAACRNC